MDDSLTTSSDIAGIAFVLGILPSSVKRLPLLAYHVAKEMYENQEKITAHTLTATYAIGLSAKHQINHP